MKLLTKLQQAKMIANGQKAQRGRRVDPIPVVKLFTPDAQATWLLTELFPDDPDIAFGLCDLGMGFPELGNVSLKELESVKGHLGLKVERDLWFKPNKPISEYAKAAQEAGRIIA